MENNSGRQSLKEHFIVQGGILAAAGIIVRIIGMLYRIPMINIIGTEGSSIYSAAYNIYNIVLILSSFGMPMAVSKMLSARLQTKEYKNAAQIFKRSLVVAIVSGGVAALILYFGAGLIESVAYRGIPGTAIPLRVLAPTVFIVAILGTVRGFFEAQGSMLQTAISQIVEQIVNAVVSIIASFAFMNAFASSQNQAAYGAAGGTLGTCLGAAAGLGVVLYIFFRNIAMYKEKVASDTSSVTLPASDTYKYIIMTIVPILIGQTCYNISAVLDDIIYNNMALIHMSTSEVTINLGNYNTTFSTLISIPMGVAAAMASSLLPSVVNSYVTSGYHSVNKKLKHTTRVTMLVAIPLAIGLVVLGQPVIQLLFSRFNSVQGDMMLKIGSAAIVFYTLTTITSTTLQGIDKMRLPVIHYAIGLAVHIPVVVILILTTKASIFSLVIGVTVFSAVVFALNLRSLYKITGYKQEIIKTFVIPGICACIMGILSLLAYKGIYALSGRNLPALIVAVAVAIIVYFGTLVLAKRRELY